MASLVRSMDKPGGVVLWSRRTRSPGRIVVLGLALVGLWAPSLATAQGTAGSAANPDSTSLVGDTLAVPVATGRPPIFLVLGLGYGTRNDLCVLCAAPEDNKAFTGHLSLGRPLAYGFGIGVDVSLWRRGRPGTPLPADSLGIPGETSLTNTLGNASVSFSYDLWHLWVRGGGGLAWGSQDLEMLDGGGAIMMHTASGWGVGYSAGAGLTIPVASVVSISFFGNWNVGYYDMISPQGLTERQVTHEYLELGVGLAVR